MKSQRRIFARALTSILACSLIPVSGQAQLKSPLLGKLVTRRNGVALVNSNPVGTGATIVSGATVETPNEVRAVVQVGQLGTFSMSAKTTAVLEFDGTRMTARVKQGCLTLNTEAKVEGWIFSPDGTSTKVGGADRPQSSSGQTCTNLPDPEAATKRLGLLGLNNPVLSWLMIAAGGYMLVGSTLGILGRDSCDPSPSSPHCCR